MPSINSSTHTPTKLAFSLIELSIVLVILGLLVGGVLAGKSLIRASELRSITTQFQTFATAHNTFKDKYFAFPGDMATATQFWGAAGAAGGLCYTALAAGAGSTSTVTCDGNGDGLLSGLSNFSESITYWQHLSNAGVLAGKYSGAGGVIWLGSDAHLPFAPASPSGKVANTLWHTFEALPLSMGIGGKKTSMILGFPTTRPLTKFLDPQESSGLDTKTDDGKPNMGRIRAEFESGLPNNCSTGNTATDTYITTNNSTACWLRFNVSF